MTHSQNNLGNCESPRAIEFQSENFSLTGIIFLSGELIKFLLTAIRYGHIQFHWHSISIPFYLLLLTGHREIGTDRVFILLPVQF